MPTVVLKTNEEAADRSFPTIFHTAAQPDSRDEPDEAGAKVTRLQSRERQTNLHALVSCPDHTPTARDYMYVYTCVYILQCASINYYWVKDKAIIHM